MSLNVIVCQNTATGTLMISLKQEDSYHDEFDAELFANISVDDGDNWEDQSRFIWYNDKQ